MVCSFDQVIRIMSSFRTVNKPMIKCYFTVYQKSFEQN